MVSTLIDDDRENAPLYELYNIGNRKPVKLKDFITEIEKSTNRKAAKNFLPMQPGDVEKTWADFSNLMENFIYKPSTDINAGVKEFVNWYKEYHRCSLSKYRFLNLKNK